jgi:hypothetical protein
MPLASLSLRASSSSVALSLLAFVAGCTASSALPCGPSGSGSSGNGDGNGAASAEDGGAVSLGAASAGNGSGTGSGAGNGSGNGSGSAGSGGSGGADGGAGAGSVGASSGDGGALDLPGPATRGASLPYFEYEAEDPAAATTNGSILPVSTTEGNIASEASGRTAVQLQGSGQNVSFTLKHRANSIVVRYSIPDAPQGGGATATLGLYVNGVRQDLALTSRYSWSYGAMSAMDSPSIANENPSNGLPHHFYDEARALFPAEMQVGTVVKLQVDAKDTAASYVVDLVDFEDVAPPLAQPAGSISIADAAYGATPDDGTDDSAAVLKAIADATAQKKVLWIPKGNFTMAPAPANLQNLAYNKVPKLILTGSITIQGAGMWYSTLEGFGAQFELMGKPTNASAALSATYEFHDFSLFGDVTWRKDADGGWHGFDGPWGLNSKLENVWIEHENVGVWLGAGWQFPTPLSTTLTQGLTVHGARIRDTYADGINMADGTSGTTIEQTNVRNSGDDSLVSWSFASDGSVPCQNNVVQFNTVQTVWHASCFALYGGTNNSFQNNTCADTANLAGMFIATDSGFNVIPFAGTNSIAHNTLTRAGGWHGSNDYAGEGALMFFGDGKPITNISIEDMLIDHPILAGIQFSGGQNVSNVSLSGVTVQSYGAEGIEVEGSVNGSAAFTSVAVSGSVNVPLKNDNGGAFTIDRVSGDTGF